MFKKKEQKGMFDFLIGSQNLDETTLKEESNNHLLVLLAAVNSYNC